MNPFQIIPPTVRKWLYLTYGVTSLALTCVTAYVTALGQPIPSWVVGGAAVLVPVGTALGFTAGANVTPDPPTEPVDPSEYGGYGRLP